MFEKINAFDIINDLYSDKRYFTTELTASISNGVVKKANTNLPKWKDINQQFNKNHNSLALICGEKSNLYVVDYDSIERFETDKKRQLE